MPVAHFDGRRGPKVAFDRKVEIRPSAEDRNWVDIRWDEELGCWHIHCGDAIVISPDASNSFRLFVCDHEGYRKLAELAHE